jgi:hypothetical protein
MEFPPLGSRARLLRACCHTINISATLHQALFAGNAAKQHRCPTNRLVIYQAANPAIARKDDAKMGEAPKKSDGDERWN